MSKEKKNKAGNIGFLLWQASNKWQRNMKAALDSIGLTHVQYLLLNALAQTGKTQTQSALAAAAGADVMMTSKVLRTLEKKKFISRKIQAGDSRSMNVQLSDAGKKILQKADVLVEKTDEDFFSALPSKRSKFVKNLSALLAAGTGK
ncbi:MAG: transcriptional regulator [Bacteroidetes bacterium]|nr:MAG: transcriptional regulator [Bacteroidota bacterium]